MKPYYSDERVTVLHGDCLDVLAAMPDASVDAIVTDPPYGLANTDPQQVADTIVRWVNGDRDYLPGGSGFMGKVWDAFVPPVAVWDECLRVLKPGGHVLAFAGSRTHDLMTLALRLAGFEIRDSIAWLYGSGFPKSLDVSKAIDKVAPRAGMFDAFAEHYAERRKASGLNHREVCEAGGFYAGVNHGGASTNWEKGYNVPTRAQWDILQPLLGLSDEWLPLIVRENAKREVLGRRAGSRLAVAPGQGMERGALDLDITAPATPDAQQWDGWGTALKPAFEPIVVARKPLVGTVAQNVLTYGTGALNIDGCRVGDEVITQHGRGDSENTSMSGRNYAEPAGRSWSGRWPANVILDESQAAALDEQSGVSKSVVRKPTGKDTRGVANGTDGRTMVMRVEDTTERGVSDSGGASRFFYTTKAPSAERPKANGVAHPTVKPLDLMRWLVRLVTPPGGVALDPFAGSGTTLEAAIVEGFRCIGIEREADYLPLIDQRIARAHPPLDFTEATA